MRRRWSAALCIAAMLTLAGPAQASTTWETGDTLYYVASAGEANTLAVNLQGENATVQDAGYPAMGMVSPCRPWEVLMMDGLGALCPAAPVARVVLDLGDAPDSLSAGAMTGSPLPTAALGGPGNDRLWSWTGNDDLTGGPGQDDLSSNGGSDLIDARDGGADNVDCGDGSDVAIVDPTDNLTSCETLLTERPADRPAPVIPTPPEPTVTATRPTPVQVPTVPSVPTEERTPPPAVHLRLVVRSVSLRTARTAGLPVQATCGEGCQVSALVRVTRERARRFGVPRTLARVTRAGTAGGTARLRMRLRGAGLARVRLLHVTIHADAVTAAGQHLVQDIALTLRR